MRGATGVLLLHGVLCWGCRGHVAEDAEPIDAGAVPPPIYAGPAADAPALSVDEFCAQYATFECELVARCCDEVVDDCSLVKAKCLEDLPSKRLDPTESFDEVAAGVCMAAMRETYSGCSVLATQHDPAMTACGMLFDRGAAPGAPCARVEDCHYQRHFFPNCYATEGCHQGAIVGEGERCLASGAGPLCDVDLSCVAPDHADPRTTSAPTTCVPTAGLDGACFWDADCAWTLHCDDATHSCVERAPVGAGCVSPQDCASINCVDGICRPTVSVCAGGDLTGWALSVAHPK